MAQDNIHKSLPANHNHPFSSASAPVAASAANHINPNLHPAMSSHNNIDIAQHTYPQSHGSGLPASYNDYFAGHDWRQPVQNANGAAVNLPRSQSSASPGPNSALQHQPWEHQTAGHMNLAAHNPEHQQHDAMSVSTRNPYGSINQSSAMRNVLHDPSHHHHQPQQRHSAPQYAVSNASPAVSVSRQHTVNATQPGNTYPASTQSQHEPVVYVPYSTPQQFPSQPTYGHGNLYPGYGIQYPQMHGAPRATPSPVPPSTTSLAEPARPPPASKQLHEVLQSVPPAQQLKSNPQFSTIDLKQLCEKTNSKLVTSLLAVSQDAVELSHGKVAQLPRFEARKNLHELRQIVGQDAELRLRIDKLDKKVRSKVASIVSSTLPPSSGSPTVKAPSPSSSEDEVSASSDESEDDLEIEEKIPIAPSRPTDPIKGAEYDVIKAVWHSRTTYLENQVLLQRIAQFSDLFSKLRDRWKVSNDALKDAEQSKATGQISSLTNKVNQNRKIVEIALKAAVQHGHPHILTMLSENKRLIAGMYGLLSDRINKKSYDDTLSVSTLQFLDRLANITTETLDTTKLSKALPYFVKRGADTVKGLAKKVIDKAVENSKKEAKATATAPANVAPSSGPEAVSTSSVPAAVKSDKSNATAAEKPVATNMLKRPRVLEASSGQPAKKQAVAPAATKTAPVSAATVVKRPVTTIGSKSSAAATTTATKPKVAIKSTTPAAIVKKAVPTTTKTTGNVRPSETSKSGFSFGGMMQNILKPAVVEAKEVPEEPVPTETAEEKAKRLKKEKRRMLRVSWKPDHDLCAIKFFTHDPEEEIGHDPSSVRDVTDVGDEGRMFKQLHKDHKEIVDVELEEEEKEESFAGEDCYSPALIDFSELNDPDVEWNKIYMPFGRGELSPESAEQELQKKREAATLMAVYITRDDIPSRPQSPSEPLQEIKSPATAFGSPDDRTRQREQALTAPVSVDMDAIARILGNANSSQAVSLSPLPPVPANPQPEAIATTSTQFNQQDLLAALKNLSNPAPPPTTSAAAAFDFATSASVADSNLPAMNPLALAGLLGNVPFPPPPPPQPASNTTSAPPPIDFNALLAHFQNQNGQTTQQPVAPPPLPPAPGAPIMPNVADLWAQLGLNQPAQPPANFGAFGNNGPIPPASQQPDNNQYGGQYEHPERKRYRETGDDELNNDQWNKRPALGISNTRSGTAKNWDSQRKPKWSYEDNSKKFTLPCKFWPLGKCTKGANCTYRHDM